MPFDQPELPGVNWRKVDKDARKALIESRYTRGIDSMSAMFSGPSFGKTRTPIHHATTLDRSSPAKDAIDALALSDIPTPDLRRGATSISSDAPTSVLSQLGAGAHGARNVKTGNILYNRLHFAPQRRAVLTHELAHALQSDLPMSTLEVELDKVQRPKLSKEINPKTNKEKRNKYDRPTNVAPELAATPWVTSQEATSEGSAEGYRKKYQGPTAAAPYISYSPDYFRSRYSHPDTTFGEDAAAAYSAAHRFTQETGSVVPDSLSHNSAHLAGVLKSDLSDTGERQVRHDIATSHRMATFLLHSAQGGNPVEHPHASEYFNRRKAIEGERVQGSMFTDLVPETDQFGQAVTGTPEQSPRGSALHQGLPTERPHALTLDAVARYQNTVKKERQKNKPPYNAGVSKYHWALKVATREKAERDAQEAEKAKRIESKELHPAVDAWLGKLVYEKKRDYAREYAHARQSGSDLPAVPQGLKEEHAEKARSSVDKLFEKHRIV